MMRSTGHAESQDGAAGQDELTVEARMARMAKKAYKIAIGLLSRREHSYLELQQKLERKLKGPKGELKGEGEACISDIVIAVLDKLVNEGLQSDERFTESYVRYRATRGRGQLLIRSELQQRGVSNHLIGLYLNDSSHDWIQLAREAREKRFGSLVPCDIQDKARQTRFLQQRGYTHDLIRSVLDVRE